MIRAGAMPYRICCFCQDLGSGVKRHDPIIFLGTGKTDQTHVMNWMQLDPWHAPFRQKAQPTAPEYVGANTLSCPTLSDPDDRPRRLETYGAKASQLGIVLRSLVLIKLRLLLFTRFLI